MFANLRLASAVTGLVCLAVVSTPDHAAAITAELAKKCSALTTKAFPPRVPGNPAAGSTKGNGLAEQNYFRRCVANGGNVADGDPPNAQK